MSKDLKRDILKYQKIKGTEIIDDVAREYLYCLNTI